MSSLDPAAIAFAALAGGLAAAAARDAFLSAPGAIRWAATAVEPLVRAGREGYAPSAIERRRIAALGAVAACLAGLFAFGPTVGVILAIAGPVLAMSAIRRREERYRRRVERGVPDIAIAVADSLSAGRSLRAALSLAAASLDGPAAVEMARVRAELDLGAPTAEALRGLRTRMRSERVDAFSAAALSQQLAGGDLAGLLRRFAVGSAERDRAAEDARSATAQARFTGLLVVAMPTGAALFAELLQPGFLAKVLGSPAAAVLLALAVFFQLIGFAAIRRLSRVVE